MTDSASHMLHQAPVLKSLMSASSASDTMIPKTHSSSQHFFAVLSCLDQLDLNKLSKMKAF